MLVCELLMSVDRDPIRDALSSEPVLLYDAEGRPIPRNSESWKEVVPEAKWREIAADILEDLFEHLEKLRPEEPASSESLRQALARAWQKAAILVPADSAQDDLKPRFVFTPHDGKLTVPVSTTIGDFEIQGTIPVYKVIALLLAGFGIYRLFDNSAAPEAEWSTEEVGGRHLAVRFTMCAGNPSDSRGLATALAMGLLPNERRRVVMKPLMGRNGGVLTVDVSGNDLSAPLTVLSRLANVDKEILLCLGGKGRKIPALIATDIFTIVRTIAWINTEFSVGDGKTAFTLVPLPKPGYASPVSGRFYTSADRYEVYVSDEQSVAEQAMNLFHELEGISMRTDACLPFPFKRVAAEEAKRNAVS